MKVRIGEASSPVSAIKKKKEKSSPSKNQDS